MELIGLCTEDELFENNKNIKFVSKREGKKFVQYANVASSFDIEVSSFMYGENKNSLMYIWQFGLNGYVVIGRTWEEFVRLINRLVKTYKLNEDRRFPCYIHNLAYEFQFMKDYFHWYRIFAREKRSPIVAMTADGIEFRCSYMLSGSSLEMVGKNLTKHKVQKMVGDLDYELIRTPNTELTDEEICYCINDVLVVMALIDEEIDTYGDVAHIPMTNTGKVREYCRQRTIRDEKVGLKHMELMKRLTIGGSEEYDILKKAFQGGFTHANYKKVGFEYKGVQSYDFTSSYPTVMVAEKFPMSKGRWIDVESLDDIEELSKDYCLIFNVEFDNIVSKIEYEHYLSFSKCFGVQEPLLDNGRVVNAKKLQTTLTDVDYDILVDTYNWDNAKIGKCIAYKKAYLPKEFVECVLDFYIDKTSLKDVEGFEKEYLLKKGMLNSCYGMSVTDIVNDEIIYEEEWDSIPANIDECIEQYNASKNRFLFYPWGVFITAYARHNLWRGILECKDDYIYSDTDSIKILNKEKHQQFIVDYNTDIIEKLTRACMFHNIPFEKFIPQTKDGKEKPLGVWDDDGYYTRFKTLGSKRYLVEYEKDDKKQLKCTIAGVNKKKTSEWLMEKKDGFKEFTDLMTVDEDHSGRMIVTYIDEPMDGVVEDYKGNRYEYHELSGIHMCKGEYHLKMSPLFLKLLRRREVNTL